MWPEIQTAKKEKRRELVLYGSEISKRIEKDGLDATIYSLTDLNFLSLTDTCLAGLSSNISDLSNLQSLILHSNKFKEVNDAVSKLAKLKILDISRNLIEKLPANLSELQQIATVNISNNKLETFPTFQSNSKLAVLDLSVNNLTTFPDVCYAELVNLSEVKLQGNQIIEIPANINVLPALKVLDLSNNKIKALPGELASCQKLKDINLKSNPISDNRLSKLIDQCRTKQILDYVKQHCPKSSKGDGDNVESKKGKKNGKSKKKSSDSENSHENEVKDYKYKITVKPAGEEIKVISENSTKTVREHIVCCLLNDVTFTEDLFKDFIKMQNKLHDGVCGQRNNATIATHDFKKLGSSNITYTTFPPNELKIKPLNRADELTGAQLFSKLQTEANNLRKEKKRNTYSGIHKYLYLIEGKSVYPSLVNEQGSVISFPPITNSDITKIEPITTQIFIEVTSSISQQICKNVLACLLKETAYVLGKDLEVQQIRILDNEEKLKLVFPSKTDLKYEGTDGILVVRN